MPVQKPMICLVLDGPWGGSATGGIARSMLHLQATLQEKANVCLLSWTSEKSRARLLWRLFRGETTRAASLVYLNGVFTPALLAEIWGRRVFRRHHSVLIIAPRGHLMEQALQKSGLRKSLFLLVLKASLWRLGTMIRWHCTSEIEANALSRCRLDDIGAVFLVPNLPPVEALREERASIHKQSGSVRLVFLGDVIPHKNVDLILNVLCEVNGNIHLDVVGATPDAAYFQRVSELAERMCKDSSKTVLFHGVRPSEEAVRYIQRAHFLILPSRSENFANVVLEALGAGRPVILSDKTPWNHLEDAGAGFVVSLTDRQRWILILKRVTDMDDGRFEQLSEAAGFQFKTFVDAYPWPRFHEMLSANSITGPKLVCS